MTTPTTVGGVASGLAVGIGQETGNFDHPEIWSYTISGGTMTSTVTDLMVESNTPLNNAFPVARPRAAIAINSSGLAVIAAMNSGTTGPVENCQGSPL